MTDSQSPTLTARLRAAFEDGWAACLANPDALHADKAWEVSETKRALLAAGEATPPKESGLK